MARKIHYTVYVPANLDYQIKQYLAEQPANMSKTDALADLLRKGLSQARQPDLSDLSNNIKLVANELEANQKQNTALMNLIKDQNHLLRQQQADTHIFYDHPSSHATNNQDA